MTKRNQKLVQQVGAQAVSVDVTSAGAKFNNHEIDILPAPVVAFKPFELYKGLGEKRRNCKISTDSNFGQFYYSQRQIPSRLWTKISNLGRESIGQNI